MLPPRPPQPKLPLFAVLFVSIFGFIGLTLLIFLWFGSSREFGAPPTFFKVFGSLVAFAFMAIGFGLPIASLRARSRTSRPAEAPPTPAGAESAGYRCPHCGAGLGDREVSPSGDVKCAYCHKWYNIHRG